MGALFASIPTLVNNVNKYMKQRTQEKTFLNAFFAGALWAFVTLHPIWL